MNKQIFFTKKSFTEMQQQKLRMWIYSDKAEHTAYREVHSQEIKYFPNLRNVLQFGWAATSFGVIATLIASQSGAIAIPTWLSVSLAVLFLASAHSLMNVTYVTALKKQGSFANFIFPAFIALLLFFADWKGSKELVSGFTYKAKEKDLNEGIYSSRFADTRAMFSRDSAMASDNAAQLIRSTCAGARGEINRLQKKTAKNTAEANWINKLIADEQATISKAESRERNKLVAAINKAAYKRDTTLSNISAERNSERVDIGKANIYELEKEMSGEKQANNAGWLISLFFLLSYAVITWRIEYNRRNGGISKDNSTTPLDAYGGIAGYFLTVLNEIFLKKSVSFINAFAKKTLGQDAEIVIREISSNFSLLGSTPTSALPQVFAEKRTEVLGFRTPNVQNITRTETPVQNITNVQTSSYELSNNEFKAQLQDAKEFVLRYVRFLRRGERFTITTYKHIDNGLAHVLGFVKLTSDKNQITEIMGWVADINEEVARLKKEVQNGNG